MHSNADFKTGRQLGLAQYPVWAQPLTHSPHFSILLTATISTPYLFERRIHNAQLFAGKTPNHFFGPQQALFPFVPHLSSTRVWSGPTHCLTFKLPLPQDTRFLHFDRYRFDIVTGQSQLTATTLAGAVSRKKSSLRSRLIMPSAMHHQVTGFFTPLQGSLLQISLLCRHLRHTSLAVLSQWTQLSQTFHTATLLPNPAEQITTCSIAHNFTLEASWAQQPTCQSLHTTWLPFHSFYWTMLVFLAPQSYLGGEVYRPKCVAKYSLP